MSLLAQIAIFLDAAAWHAAWPEAANSRSCFSDSAPRNRKILNES
jgi:hypothetical protein